jgi:K+-transporting ATPase ATPase C chain
MLFPHNRAHNLSEETLNKLVVEHIENRQFGFLGEQRINLLELNLALDKMK